MPEAEFLVWLKTTLLAAPGVSGLFGDRVLTPDDVGARGLAYDDLTAEPALEDRFVDSATGELKLLAYVSPEMGSLMGRWWYKYRFRIFYYVSARNSAASSLLMQARLAFRLALHFRSTPRLLDSRSKSVGIIKKEGGDMLRFEEAALQWAAGSYDRYCLEFAM